MKNWSIKNVKSKSLSYKLASEIYLQILREFFFVVAEEKKLLFFFAQAFLGKTLTCIFMADLLLQIRRKSTDMNPLSVAPFVVNKV